MTKDYIKLTPPEPDTCYIDLASNRAVLAKAQPFNGELDGIDRFREDFPEWGVIPIYTWHPEYDSPHESEFYHSTDFLLDLLDVETLPFPWQPAGENFEPVVKAAADRGFYIVPIEVRENSRSPYRLGYTVGNGYIADGLAIAPMATYDDLEKVVSVLDTELALANAYYQGQGFEMQLYDLETGELLGKDHTVGFTFFSRYDPFISQDPRNAFRLSDCPDFSSVKQQLKSMGLSPRSKSNSLSDLAQEAKTASRVLSNKERNIEVKEHEER